MDVAEIHSDTFWHLFAELDVSLAWRPPPFPRAGGTECREHSEETQQTGLHVLRKA